MSYETEILLVEDNSSDAELTMRILKKNHHLNKVVHLEDGEVALDYLFATGKYKHRNVRDIPKLILLDINMPKVNGMEVLKKIKSDARTKMIPLVLFSSSGENKDIVEGYKHGANGYVVKPLGYKKFEESVTEIGQYWIALNQSPYN